MSSNNGGVSSRTRSRTRKAGATDGVYSSNRSTKSKNSHSKARKAHYKSRKARSKSRKPRSKSRKARSTSNKAPIDFIPNSTTVMPVNESTAPTTARPDVSEPTPIPTPPQTRGSVSQNISPVGAANVGGTTADAAGEEDPELEKLRQILNEKQQELGNENDESKKYVLGFTIRGIETTITQLLGTPTNGMDALKHPLPQGSFDNPNSRHGTDSSSIDGFRHYPLTFNVLTQNSFMKRATEEILQLSSKFPSEYFMEHSYTKGGVAQDEPGVFANIYSYLCHLLVYAGDNKILLPQHQYFSGSKGTVGKVDSYISPEAKLPSVYVEVKTVGYKMRDMGSNFKNEFRQRKSPIRQLYNYMVNNSSHFGILSSFDEWTGFIRDCSGNVVCTPTFHSSYVGDKTQLSVSQFVIVFCLMAYEPEKILKRLREEGLVDCSKNNTHILGKEDALSYFVTMTPQAEDNEDQTSRNGSVNVTKQHALVSFSELSVHDLIGPPTNRTSVGSGLMGTAWNAVVYGEPAILKTADIFKHPEFEKTMQCETKIYSRLSELQGQCIPKLLGHGRMLQGFLYALATEPVGEPISLKHIDKLETYRERATEVLQQVHKLGVLHGDIRAPNLLIHPDGERVFLIDFGMSEVFEPSEVDDDPTNWWTTRMLQEQHELDEIFDSLQEQSKCCEYKRGQDVVKKLKF